MSLSKQLITKGMLNPSSLIAKGFITTGEIVLINGKTIPLTPSGGGGSLGQPNQQAPWEQEIIYNIDKVGVENVEYIRLNVNPNFQPKDININMSLIKVKIRAILYKKYKEPITIKMRKDL